MGGFLGLALALAIGVVIIATFWLLSGFAK